MLPDRQRSPTDPVAPFSGDDAAMASDDERIARRDLVRRGYDLISHHYHRDDEMPTANKGDGEATHSSWIEELGSLLDPGARVLDLGCGAGIPATKLLADAGFTVTGVDISQVQVERARSLVPNAEIVQADMAVWESPPARFDGIVSLYSIFHLPLDDQRQLIPRLADGSPRMDTSWRSSDTGCSTAMRI